MRLTFGRRDQHSWLGILALAGLVAGGALAVFGLPPVDLHGPLHYIGIMDPFCGGTRGMQAMMRGDVGDAWRYNPLSIALVVGAVGVLLRQAVGLVSRRWLNVQVTHRRATLIVVAVLAVALEINQQANADLLMASGHGFSPLLPILNLFLIAVVWLVLNRRFRRLAAAHRPIDQGR